MNLAYGDIILQAESIQFRIGRDVLAAQSSVFHDMFSVPQPPHQPTVDGCPVVQVLGDSAKDWELLHALYHPFGEKETSLELVAAMLRLGRKYAMDQIRGNAISRINYEFPPDLKSWSQRGNFFTKIQFQDGLILDLLNLTYECGIKSSIPTLAFDILDSVELENLINDEQLREDDSLVILATPLKFMLAVATERLVIHQASYLSRLIMMARLSRAKTVLHACCVPTNE